MKNKVGSAGYEGPKIARSEEEFGILLEEEWTVIALW